MKKCLGIALLVFAALCLFAAFTASGSTLAAGLFVAAISAIIGLRLMGVLGKKRTQPAAAAAPDQPAQLTFNQRLEQASSINFRVAGVTFNDRQRTLQKIDDADDEKYRMCCYGIEQTEYKGSPAFSIYAELMDDNDTRKELGFVPADLVNDVLRVYPRIFHVKVEVHGGYSGKSYGASATLYYDT